MFQSKLFEGLAPLTLVVWAIKSEGKWKTYHRRFYRLWGAEEEYAKKLLVRLMENEYTTKRMPLYGVPLFSVNEKEKVTGTADYLTCSWLPKWNNAGVLRTDEFSNHF